MVWQLIPALLGALAVGLAVGAVVTLIMVTIEHVRNWFRERRAKSINLGKVPFTLKEEMDAGRVKIVAGFFDQSTGETTETQVYDAEKMDSELTDLHRHDKVVVYN